MKYKNCTRLFNAATANLDRMFEGKRKDYIGKFTQKAVIKVHEKGAEATASTGAVFTNKSIAKKKKTYVINRPFKFFIHSTKLDFNLKKDQEQSINLFFTGVVNCPMNNCK